MLCKSYQKKIVWIVLMILGLFIMVFGIVFHRYLPEDTHSLSMLSGMCTGLGGAFLVISAIRLIAYKIKSPEQLKQEEIELKDERNIQILRISYTMVALISILLFASMTFLFLALDFLIPALVAVGGLTIDMIVFLITYSIYSKKI